MSSVAAAIKVVRTIRKKFLLLSVILLGGTAIYSLAAQLSPYERNQTYMPLTEVKARWGTEKFNEQKFKTGLPQERSRMAFDLITSKTFVGKPTKEVRDRLGSSDGFFWSEKVPAYVLYDGWKKNENTWQIVFLPDIRGRVKDVRVHRNCCDDSVWKERGLPIPKN